MAVYGPLARTVADSARLMDVLRDGGPSFSEAAATDPGKLRIAVSLGLPPLGVKVDDEQRSGRGVHRGAAARARPRGRRARAGLGPLARQPRPHALRARTRGPGDRARPPRAAIRAARKGIARIGTTIPSRLADSADVAAAEDAVRLNRIFDESDLVLTPMFTRRPLRVREYDGTSGIRTLTGKARLAPYSAAFNHTGQPAVSRARGVHGRRLPARRPARRPVRVRSPAVLAHRAARAGPRVGRAPGGCGMTAGRTARARRVGRP